MRGADHLRPARDRAEGRGVGHASASSGPPANAEGDRRAETADEQDHRHRVGRRGRAVAGVRRPDRLHEDLVLGHRADRCVGRRCRRGIDDAGLRVLVDHRLHRSGGRGGSTSGSTWPMRK